MKARTLFQNQYDNVQLVEGGFPDGLEQPPFQLSYVHSTASNVAGAHRHGNMEHAKRKLALLIVDLDTGLHSNNWICSGNDNVYWNGNHMQSTIQDVKDPQISNGGSPVNTHVQQGCMFHSPPRLRRKPQMVVWVEG